MRTTIGDRIRDAREERGLSASDLARKVEVTPTAVWNWEKNGTKPRPEALSSVAKVLGCSVEFLQSGEVAQAAPNQQSVRDIIARAEALVAEAIGVERGLVKLRLEVSAG